MLEAFNHAIAYLPDYDLYLDSTIGMAPFDALPEMLRGRPALVAGDSKMKAAIRRTPDVDPARDRTISRTAAKVAADGTVVGTMRIEAHGAMDAGMRTTLTVLPEQALPQFAKQMLAANGQSGDATATIGDLRNFNQPNLLTIDFTSPGRINLPGPGALTGGIGPQGSSARNFSTAMLQQERKLDFPCPAGGNEEVLELALAPGMKITTLPANADITSPFGHFIASYSVKDGKLLVSQTLDLRRSQTVCTAADYVELRKFAVAIDKELRKQILYE